MHVYTHTGWAHRHCQHNIFDSHKFVLCSWCRRCSNLWSLDLKSDALPTELPCHPCASIWSWFKNFILFFSDNIIIGQKVWKEKHRRRSVPSFPSANYELLPVTFLTLLQYDWQACGRFDFVEPLLSCLLSGWFQYAWQLGKKPALGNTVEYIPSNDSSKVATAMFTETNTYCKTGILLQYMWRVSLSVIPLPPFPLPPRPLSFLLLPEVCAREHYTGSTVLLYVADCPVCLFLQCIFLLLFSKSSATLNKFKIDQAKVCVVCVHVCMCVCVSGLCVSLTSDSSEIIIKLGTVNVC